MSSTPNDPVDQNPKDPAGSTQNIVPVEQKEINDPKPSTVSYTSHLKVLAEKKRAKERAKAAERKLQEIEAQKNEANDSILLKNQEWSKLVQSKDEQIKSLKAKAEEYDGFKQDIFKQKTMYDKREAVFKAFKSPVKAKFRDLIDVSGVAIDPETNEIDYDSAVKVAESYQKNMPEFFDVRGTITMPSNSPMRGERITRAQWMKLSSKEMLAKRHLVVDE